jgi:hypothetical protein
MDREPYGRNNGDNHGGKEKSNPEPVGHKSLDAKTKVRQTTFGANLKSGNCPGREAATII